MKIAIVAGLVASMLAGTAMAQDKTLNMIVIEGGDTTAMQAVADAYTAAHPGVTIKLQPYPFAQFFQVAELRLRSKDAGVDLVYVDAPLVASYASRGFLSPVDAGISTADLVTSALDAGKYDGPADSTNVLMYEAYKSGFVFGDMGRAMAIIVVVVAILLVIVGLQFKLLSGRKEAR